jgi:hypothetical protein
MNELRRNPELARATKSGPALGIHRGSRRGHGRQFYYPVEKTGMLSVAIPCHRDVRTDGALSGYRWGVARKGALFTREATPCALA